MIHLSKAVSVNIPQPPVNLDGIESDVIQQISFQPIQQVAELPKAQSANDIINATSSSRMFGCLSDLRKNYENSVSKLINNNSRLTDLYSNRPTNLSDWPDHEREIQKALVERSEAILELQRSTGVLRATTIPGGS